MLRSFMIMSRVTLTRETVLAIGKYGEDLEKNEGDWTRKVEIRTRKKILVVGSYSSTNSSVAVTAARHRLHPANGYLQVFGVA